MREKWKNFFGKRLLAALAVACIGILLFVILSHFGAVRSGVGWVFNLIQPFIIAIAIAYLLDIPIRFFARTLFKKYRYKRVFSIILVYILAFALLALLIGMMLPQLYDSIENLLRNIPTYLGNLQDLADWITRTFGLEADALDSIVISYTDLISSIAKLLADTDIIDWTVNLGTEVVKVIVTTITAIIASVYMLAGKDKLLNQIKKVVYAIIPQRATDEIYRIAALTNKMFSGFISGKIIDSAIIGVMCWIFMFIANLLPIFPPMPYALLISVIVGVTNVIPFFGPFIGAIPSVLILLMVNPGSALVFAVFVLLLQQFDGNILGPKILGDTTGLPAMWVLVAIIVGGGLNGFAGMIWGVPVAAVLYTILSDVVAKRLKEKHLDGEGNLLPDDAEGPGPPGPVFSETLPEQDVAVEPPDELKEPVGPEKGE